MVLFWILVTLLAALVILVPLIERFGPRMSKEDLAKIGRYVLPLMAILLILQLLSYVFK